MMSALVSIENAVDVTTINGLLKEVVREERYLQAALVGTVAKKEYICQRLAQHQASISALSSLHEGSSVLHAEVSELNTSAREVSDQVRRLDTDQIRVEAAIARLSLNADIVACTDGITISLENHEYEAATAFVEGLAHLQQSIVSVEEQTPLIHSTLFLHTREVVAAVIRDKINAAISQDNITEVLRFGKLFPKLYLSAEGLTKICQFLCKGVAKPSSLETLSEIV